MKRLRDVSQADRRWYVTLCFAGLGLAIMGWAVVNIVGTNNDLAAESQTRDVAIRAATCAGIHTGDENTRTLIGALVDGLTRPAIVPSGAIPSQLEAIAAANASRAATRALVSGMLKSLPPPTCPRVGAG